MAIKVALILSKHGEPEALEVEYASVVAANTDLDYMGQYYEDIALISVVGATAEQLGF